MTYETASTRRYKCGRTENIRVLSEDGYYWARAAANASSEGVELASKNLDKFIATHLETAKNSSLANALDRHLLGLTKVRREEDEALPSDLFEADKVFDAMFQFDMSTSNMSPGHSFQGLGFGTLTPSGYGVNYCISESRLLFSVSAWEYEHTSQKYPMFDCPRFDVNGQPLQSNNGKVPSKEWHGGPSRAQIFKGNLQTAIQMMKRILDHKIGRSFKL